MRRLLKVATPALAATETVPWRVPVPVLIVAVTVEPSPMTVLPYASSTLTTGWVANAEPAAAPAGPVATTSCEAAAGLTVIPELAPVIAGVTVSSTLTVREPAVFNVFAPEAIVPLLPESVPVPATTASETPVPATTLLGVPHGSCDLIVTEKFAPAATFEPGTAVIPSLVGAPSVTVKAALVPDASAGVPLVWLAVSETPASA